MPLNKETKPNLKTDESLSVDIIESHKKWHEKLRFIIEFPYPEKSPHWHSLILNECVWRLNSEWEPILPLAIVI